MDIHVVTIFPELFTAFLDTGIVGRAVRNGTVAVHVHDLRDYTHDRHRSVDDSPFGGGPGMVMRPEPLFEAIDAIAPPPGSPVVILTPQGTPYSQRDAERLATNASIVFICGRYEGMDERAHEALGTEEISIGDYVLTGGELPAMVVIDSVARLQPGALGHSETALVDDSHTSGLLQYPQYTRPAEYRGMSVPDVLLSGDHAAVDKWRRQAALRRTLERRPDLLENAVLTGADIRYLKGLGWAARPQSPTADGP
jgi:tRNA (guanine37-N1)-methyltransferase